MGNLIMKKVIIDETNVNSFSQKLAERLFDDLFPYFFIYSLILFFCGFGSGFLTYWIFR